MIPLQPVATTRLAIASNAPIGAGHGTIDRILHTRPLKMLDSVQNRLTNRELEPINGAEQIPDHQTYAQTPRDATCWGADSPIRAEIAGASSARA